MQRVSEILTLWSELTGLDRQDPKFAWGDVAEMSREVRRAQELDHSDALALMLLEPHVEAFLKTKTFTVAGMLADLNAHVGYLRRAERLRNFIAASGMHEARRDLLAWVRMALRHYGAEGREDVGALLADTSRVATLWRDALDAMDRTLEAHQFMQGEPDTAAPLYHENVLSTWTVNGLLQAMVSMPSGIALALVRDARAAHSFFAFGIRNGGTLTVLTDRPDWAHPFAKRLTRKPERHLSARMARSWFPYSVLDIRENVDERGEVVGIHVPRQEGLVPRESVARRSTRIADLQPEEVVWAAMMFDLIAKRYFRDGAVLPALSYLGEQVVTASGMEVDAFARGLPTVGYVPLAVEPLTGADVARGAFAASEAASGAGRTGRDDDGEPWGDRGTNLWMEDRYAGLVDPSVLNHLGPPGTVLPAIGRDGVPSPVPRDAPTKLDARRWTHESFDASAFATRERLLADRTFTGRHNLAAECDRLAHAEFAERRAEVERWWLSAVVAAKPALLAAIGRGELLGRPSYGSRRHHRTPDGDMAPELRRGNILDLRHDSEVAGEWLGPLYHKGVFLSDDVRAGSVWGTGPGVGAMPWTRCPVTGAKPSWRARFTPRDAGDMALMVGIPVGDFPDVVRHWTRAPAPVGNHLSDRVDPMLWVTDDPWRTLDFGVDAWVSRSGLVRLAKAAGVTAPAVPAEAG